MTPRLRTRRDFNWEPTNEDFPEARSPLASDAESEHTGYTGYTGYEVTDVNGANGTSGSSWLSNAAVIASIPDDKLHSTLQRYRSLVRLLEQEISAKTKDQK